ncbi:MAG TPA: MFS transporter [Methylomirabilota bacterium]|nr:MFS transporter [Methylomirabilota bacterium]
MEEIADQRAATVGTATGLARNVVALFAGLSLWTAIHFGSLALLPLYLHDQGYDPRGIGFALGAMGVAQLAMRPFGGWIVDAFGRRGPLVLSLGLLAVACALLAIPSCVTVLANRVLTGIAFSVGTTAFYALSIEVAPPERRSEVQGYVALGLTLGVALGPPILVGLYRGAAADGTPADRLPPIALGAAAVAVLGGICFRATSSPVAPRGRAHPYSLRASFRREGLLPALLNFCAQVPNTGFSAFLPLWALGRGVPNPGLLFVASQAGSVASRLFAGRLADRHGRAAVLGPALGGVGLVLAGLTAASGWPAFLALSLVYGALFGVAFVILPTLAAEATPPEGRGAALNTFGLGSDLAQLLGPWGLGLAGSAWGLAGALVAASLVPLGGTVALLAARAGGRKRARRE